VQGKQPRKEGERNRSGDEHPCGLALLEYQPWQVTANDIGNSGEGEDRDNFGEFGRVSMAMGMPGSWLSWLIVLMVMVQIVHAVGVLMIMSKRLRRIYVGVTFREMRYHAYGHQYPNQEQCHGNWFVKQRKRYQRQKTVPQRSKRRCERYQDAAA